MTITYTIPGVPLINQLKEPTSDGRPDENARDNCVFASNAAMATAYLHKPFNGDQLKDMDNNYGQGYVGFASEANLLDTMARLGIVLIPFHWSDIAMGCQYRRSHCPPGVSGPTFVKITLSDSLSIKPPAPGSLN